MSSPRTGSRSWAWPKPCGSWTWRISGPFLVESDFAGASLFERENAKIAPNIEKLYAGTKPATMRRFGETNDKTDEIIGTEL